MRALRGDAVHWGPLEHLVADAVELLAVGNWQRAGDKRRSRPKRIDRPGQRPTRHRKLTPEQVHERLEDLRRRDVARRAQLAQGDV